MTSALKFALAACLAALVATLTALPAQAGCRRLGFSVNDYGKDGPTKDALALLDKHIAQWAADQGIENYLVGKKDVSCELSLNLIVVDEHTCKASATVCWGGDKPPAAPAQQAKSSPKGAPATKAKKEAQSAKSGSGDAAPDAGKAADAKLSGGKPADTSAAKAADTGSGDTKASDAKAAEAGAPATKTSATGTSGANAAGADAPEAKATDTKAPDTKAAAAKAPAPAGPAEPVETGAIPSTHRPGENAAATHTTAAAPSVLVQELKAQRDAAQAAAAAAERAAAAAERAAAAIERAAALLSARATADAAASRAVQAEETGQKPAASPGATVPPIEPAPSAGKP